ncbi:MAG TPA: CBS domain-containing protein [Acidobacteria bacterium]|nr:CBS domain-containing protein [Acidobacteriota bacterium]
MEHQVKAILRHKGSEVHSVAPHVTVADAARAMNEKKIGALLVVDEDRPVGMFTERDILRRVIDSGRDPSQTKVQEVMSSEIVAIHPEATVEGAMAVMTEKRCRHLPVLEDEKVVGMVSIGDLTRWVSRRQANHIKDLVAYITGAYPR